MGPYENYLLLPTPLASNPIVYCLSLVSIIILTPYRPWLKLP